MDTSEYNKARSVYRVTLKLLKFAALIAALLLLFYSISSFILNKHSYKVKPETQVLICGPSVLKCSFDATRIPYTENISQEAEFFGISKIKLKSILNNGPAPKYLVLYFSPGMFLNKTDNLFDNPLVHKVVVHRLFPVASAQDLINLGIPPKMAYQNLFQARFLPNKDLWPFLWRKNISAHDYPYIGKYRRHYNSNVQKTKESILENITPKEGWESTFKEQHVNDLKEIISFAQEKGIQIILTDIPEHQEVKALVNPFMASQYDNLKKEILSDSSILLFDISDLSLPDSMYYNISHLNSYGAEVCSDTLKSWMLSNNMLD